MSARRTTQVGEGGRANRLRPGSRLRGQAAVAGVIVGTVVVGLIYAVEPQSPRNFLDRLILLVDADAYGANRRGGELLRLHAERARSAGADSLALAIEWAAARAYARAAASAADPRQELSANDGLADVYLHLGHVYLARGRGGPLGLGRDAGELSVAENIAACVVSLAPTRRRGELNAYLEQLEEVLKRPAAGRCPT